MPREKANYRDMLSYLIDEKKLPLLMNKGQACDALSISRTTLELLIDDGSLKYDNGKITIGSLASYLC